MKKFVLAAAAIGIAASTSTAAFAETEMRAISFIPKNHPVMSQARAWTDLINKELKGQVKINYVGGPEVVNRYQQFDAAKNGVVDIIFHVWADIQDRLPTMATSWLSKCTLEQERENGLFEFHAQELAKLNLKHIGRVQWSPFYLWVDTKPETLADLKGKKMRTGSLYDKMMQKLGMVPVTMNAPETYTALERGVVNGFGWPTVGPRQLGWLKGVKYVIDLPFFHNSNMGIMMNMDQWKKLPKEAQDKMLALTKDFEKDMVEYYKNLNEEEWKKIGDSVTKVKFSEEENKKYLDAAYDTEWAELEKKVGKEKVAELKKLACD